MTPQSTHCNYHHPPPSLSSFILCSSLWPHALGLWPSDISGTNAFPSQPLYCAPTPILCISDLHLHETSVPWSQTLNAALPLSALGFVGDMCQSPAKSLGILHSAWHIEGAQWIFLNCSNFNFGNNDKAVIRPASHPEQLPEFASLLLKGWCMCVHILQMLIVDNMIQWLNKLELTPSTCSIHLQFSIINAGDFVNWAGPDSPMRHEHYK